MQCGAPTGSWNALTHGVGSDATIHVAGELRPWPDGGVRRVAAPDTWVAFPPRLEQETPPRVDDGLAGIPEPGQP